MLTQNELKQVIRYDPFTGWFIKNNVPIGSRQKNGYLTIRIKYKSYYLHRLAFLYMTGKFPDNDVDHINSNRADNSWLNLREATRSQNLMNRSANIGKKLPKNVYRYSTRRFRVQMKINGIKMHFGYFDTVEEAVAKATEMRTKYFEEYAKHI
jgi:hypothetical protein